VHRAPMSSVWTHRGTVTYRDPGVNMDKDSPEAWGVAYVSDSGKALTLDKLFLCKNCEPIEDHVRASFKSYSSY